MNNKGSGKVVFIILTLLVIIIGLFMYFDTVPAGHVGVTDTFGVVGERSLEPGLHGTGFFTDVVPFEVRVKKAEYMASAASRDLQSVSTEVAVNYQVSGAKAPNIYKDLGLQFEDTIVQPLVQEAVKSVSAQYTAEELITKRSSAKQDITNYLIGNLEEQGLLVTEVSITDFQFSAEFDEAIERKVRAEQEVLTAKNELERIRVEAEQKVATAEAEAEALRVQRQELSNQLLELRRIEAQVAAVNKWDGNMPQVVMSGEGSQTILPLDAVLSSTGGSQ